MTIVEFYQRLTEIMEEYESRNYDLKEARKELKNLLEEARKNKLENINVSGDILDEVEQIDEDQSYEDSSMIC